VELTYIRKLKWGFRMQREKLETTNFCECGCKQIAKPGSRFIRGHNGKGVKGHTPWNKGITKKDDSRIRGGLQIEKVIVTCDACGKKLERNPCHINRKKTEYNFCNKECQSLFKKPKKKRNYKKRLAFVLDPNVKCHWCGEPANYMFSTGNPCCESRPFRCSGFSTHSGAENGMFGRNHTETAKQSMSKNNAMKHAETAKKVSEALTGRNLSSEHCKAISEGKKGLYTGPDNPMWGTKRSPRARQLTSEANSGEKNFFFGKRFFGEDNGFWKGGTSFEPYNATFNSLLKEKIRERDGYVCQCCGMTERENLNEYDNKLNIHHLDYDKKNDDETNLISLCHPCHSLTNGDREHWQSFYQDLIRVKYISNL